MIDADLIAKELTQKDTPAFKEIVGLFGQSVLDDQGEINRKKLKNIVFSDLEKKKQLEDIIHPLVKQRINQVVQDINVPYCIITIPLLIEANMLDLVDRIALIDCSIQRQIERVMQRDHCTEQQAMTIINTQTNRTTRIAHADDIISNEHDLSYLQNQLYKAHKKWKSLQS